MFTDRAAIDLRDLEAFAAAGQTLHFSRAADSLNIAQSALSQRVRRLERQIGVPLFARTTRVVALTPAGKVLLDRAATIFDQIEDAVSSARQAAYIGFERLTLGSATGRPHATLAALLAAVRERHPLIEISVRQANNDRLLADLQAGRLDLAFVWEYIGTPDGRPAEHTGLVGLEIGRQPLQLLLPSSHRLAGESEIHLTDVALDSFLTYAEAPGGSVFRSALFTLCREAGFTPKIVDETTSGAAMLLMVSSGAGVSLLPPTYESLTIPGCAHVALADSAARLRYSIQHRQDDDRPPIALVRSLLPGLVAEDRAS